MDSVEKKTPEEHQPCASCKGTEIVVVAGRKFFCPDCPDDGVGDVFPEFKPDTTEAAPA